ncbi:MAG: glycosyltransferase family 2 protein [Myxococcota bacterium]|nr:glycosyltransferase family 2 protein [Myxococcota bacterium]
MRVSVVIPCYNEEENLGPCIAETLQVLDEAGLEGELLVIDDGSTDGSGRVMGEWAARSPRVRVIRLRRNFGQTAAMVAGIDHAQGEVILALDADRQNDPRDIPRLLALLDEGWDVVSGWRRHRQDRAVSRLFPSRVANWLIARISGVRLHDFGCTLKAYRRELIQEVRLYGEMHRFIPIHVAWGGGRVTELEVNHRPRLAGRSKYGIWRTPKVLVDLLTLKFLGDYSTRPAHFFGAIGLLFCTLGFFSGAFALFQKFAWGVWAHKNPLVLLAVFLFSVGVQIGLIGLLADLLMRTYHESVGKPIYRVRETLNLEPAEVRRPR